MGPHSPLSCFQTRLGAAALLGAILLGAAIETGRALVNGREVGQGLVQVEQLARVEGFASEAFEDRGRVHSEAGELVPGRNGKSSAESLVARD